MPGTGNATFLQNNGRQGFYAGGQWHDTSAHTMPAYLPGTGSDKAPTFAPPTVQDQATQADKRLADTWGPQKFHGPKPGKQTGSRYVDDFRDIFQPLPAYPIAGGVTGPSGFAPGGRWAELMPLPQPLPAYPAGPPPMLPNPDGAGSGGGNGNTSADDSYHNSMEQAAGGSFARRDQGASRGKQNGREVLDSIHDKPGNGNPPPDEDAKDDTADEVGQAQTAEEKQAAYEEAMAGAMQDSYSGRAWGGLDENRWFTSLDDGEPDTLGQAAMEAALPWGGAGKRLYDKNKDAIDSIVDQMDPQLVANAAIEAGFRINTVIAVAAVIGGGAVLEVGTGGELAGAVGRAIWYAGQRAAIRLGIGGATGAVGDAVSSIHGRRGFEPKLPAGELNPPAMINGRVYTGHALDQMQHRGLVPSVIEEALTYGARTVERDGCLGYSSADAKVIINELGDVVTVYGQ